MPPTIIERPAATEYAPAFETYVSKVGHGNVLEILKQQGRETVALFGGLSDQDARFRYAEGKWSIKQVLGHVTDSERIMVYRALCFARGEQAGLPGFEEDDYVRNARLDSRPLADLLAEFQAVRAATLPFFAGLDAEELMRRGTASNRPFSVRALAYIVAGHERHHVLVLEERYLKALGRG